jgi:GNAT superfamily N-acetyltransferase
VGEAGLLTRVFATLQGYYELGAEVLDEPLARFVRNVDASGVYDVNHASRVRAESSHEVDAVLARADEVFVASHHRVFDLDPWTPEAFPAALLLDGYELVHELELLLEGELHLTREPPAVEIRLAESDEDWAVLEALTRLDHEEEAQRENRAVREEEVTAQMVVTKRAKAPGLRFWLARADGTDCAFFSSWPGTNGVGKVEDLFTHPDYRHRGIATALIARCVRDTRERGARAVLIGARPSDTPKDMYAAIGFRPFCVAHRCRKVRST